MLILDLETSYQLLPKKKKFLWLHIEATLNIYIYKFLTAFGLAPIYLETMEYKTTNQW